MTDTQLPKLPEPAERPYVIGDVYTADQMRAYASEAVRAALAAQGEPIYYAHINANGKVRAVLSEPRGAINTPLYTAPPAPAKPMTDEQVCVLRFLLGEVGIDGCYFGDIHPDKRGRFWWRKNLRDAFGITDKGGA